VRRGLPFGLGGLAGLAYCVVVLRRTRHQASYRPVLEDWLCHTVLRPIAYAGLLVAAVTLSWRPVATLFDVGR